MAANELTIIVDADIDGLRRQLETARNETQSFADRVGKVGEQITKLGTAMTVGLTVPIVALGKSALEAYGEIQSLQLGLESVLGDAKKAGDEFQRLKEVAKLPGIGLQEAVRGSINLQAIGLSAKTSRKILLEFGNAVASVGKGRVEFDRAIYGVQQLANTPFPLGEDLNIIADALPQVRTLLKDAFGKTRSDDLAKMGVTSKQVLDVIINGLGKLPRVSGGIKNAFENLKDSTTQSLARIGKVIDDNFNISGIIDKLTGYLDSAISAFEGLDPVIQKVIIGVVGLVAAAGPLLVAVGGFMALLPTLSAGIAAIGSLFGALLSPIGLVTVALVGVVAAVVSNWDKIRPYLEENIDRFKRLYNESLAFRVVIGSLAATTESTFKIVGIALEAVYGIFKSFGKGVLEILTSVGQVFEGVLTADFKKVTNGLARGTAAVATSITGMTSKSMQGLSEMGSVFIDTAKKYAQFRFDLSKKTDLGLKGLGEDLGIDKLIGGSPKTKKERERQIAEIIPEGSIADFQKRAELLKKSIDYSVDGLVRVRGLDKFGKDMDKNGNPYYTGLVLPIEQAYEELEKLNVASGQVDLQPIKINNRGFLDGLNNEFKTYGELLSAQNTQFETIFNAVTTTIEVGAAKMLEKTLKVREATEELNKSIKETLDRGLADSIASTFENVGSAIANGQNVLQALGSSLVAAFGGILTQLGKQMITYGTSLLALKIAMKSLNPYVAIAAGAALVAIGAAVTGAVRNQSNAIGGGGVSGSTGSSTQTSYSSNYATQGSGGGSVYFRIEGRDLVGVLNREIANGNRINAG